MHDKKELSDDDGGNDEIMMSTDEKHEDAEWSILLDSPVGDSQSNGDIESAIKQVQGLFRTMRSDMETNYNKVLPATQHVMPFIVRHAGGTINREQIGADGMTAHERLRGEEFKEDQNWRMRLVPMT